MKKIKICIVIQKMGGGGAERVTSHIANRLSEKNFDVTLMTLVSGDSFYKLNPAIHFVSASCEINRKNTVTRKISLITNLFRAEKFVFDTIEKIKPDIIISMLTTADRIVYLVKKFGKYKNFKWISSERADPERRTLFLRKTLNKIYLDTDAFVCQSRQMYQYYKKVPNKYIIPNPLMSDELPDVIDEKVPMEITAAGRLAEQKNFSMLIDAFYLAEKELKQDVRLKIYGEGQQRILLQKKIEDYHLEEKICLTGSVPNLPEKINGSALFVLSSNFEGFPNVLLEAMAMGLPVISTDFPTGVARELIAEKNGIIVPINNVTEMKCAMVKILTQAQLRKEMRKNNVYVREKYNIDTVIEQWIKMIREIL